MRVLRWEERTRPVLRGSGLGASRECACSCVIVHARGAAALGLAIELDLDAGRAFEFQSMPKPGHNDLVRGLAPNIAACRLVAMRWARSSKISTISWPGANSASVAENSSSHR